MDEEQEKKRWTERRHSEAMDQRDGRRMKGKEHISTGIEMDTNDRWMNGSFFEFAKIFKKTADKAKTRLIKQKRVIRITGNERDRSCISGYMNRNIMVSDYELWPVNLYTRSSHKNGTQ